MLCQDFAQHISMALMFSRFEFHDSTNPHRSGLGGLALGGLFDVWYLNEARKLENCACSACQRKVDLRETHGTCQAWRVLFFNTFLLIIFNTFIFVVFLHPRWGAAFKCFAFYLFEATHPGESSLALPRHAVPPPKSCPGSEAQRKLFKSFNIFSLFLWFSVFLTTACQPEPYHSRV